MAYSHTQYTPRQHTAFTQEHSDLQFTLQISISLNWILFIFFMAHWLDLDSFISKFTTPTADSEYLPVSMTD